MLKVVPDLLKLDAVRTLFSFTSRYFKSDKLRQVFSFETLLVGGNPFETSAIYTLIHHLEREWGVYYALGGTGALVGALVTLIEELGGKFHYNAEVTEIMTQGKQAAGICLSDGSMHVADHVVSNADVAFTYMNLLSKSARGWRNSDWRYQNLTRYSMSLFVIYFGTKCRYTDSRLAHHNIILG